MKTLLLDTNYFVRYLVKDNEDQFAVVKSLFAKAAKGEVRLATNTVVIFEVLWVLMSFYAYPRTDCADALFSIIDLSFLEYPERSVMIPSLRLFKETSLDLEDCFNIYYAKQFELDFVTFDVKALKQFKKTD